MERLRIELDSDEFEALSCLAERDLRPMPCQARHIVRAALQQAGLLRSIAESEPERWCPAEVTR